MNDTADDDLTLEPLADGKTETWVADRTGHKSHSTIKRYTRQAHAASDL